MASKSPDKKLLSIEGSAGAIEAMLETPQEFDGKRVALLCHPHPLYEGTMDNKVVHTLARAFHDTGFATLRFNFRGVGNSEGEHDEGAGETEDTVLLAAWLGKQFPDARLSLAGFSFGGMIAAKAASGLKPETLVTVAPAVGFIKSGDAAGPGAPWLLVQGGQDEVIDPQVVTDWAGTLAAPPEIIMIAGTGHFFHGQLVTLRQHVVDWLSRQMAAGA